MKISECAYCGKYLGLTTDAFVVSYWDGAGQTTTVIRQFCRGCVEKEPELFIFRIIPEEKKSEGEDHEVKD
jgi:hypothetical protein